MQQVPDISFSFLETQTCTNCQLPVTCGPVYVVSDLSILCGRCRMTAKDYYRNYAYEALASLFLYPCKNWRNHCPVKLRWSDSLDHEPECNYIGCCTFLCSHPGAFLKGKRDLPDDIPRLTLIPENLLEYLECVLCRGYLSSSPVYIQSNGQNICHRCIYANGNPPNCRRNHAYENYSQIFLFPCIYRHRGCHERIQFGPAIWQHESTCDYGSNKNSHRELNQVESIRSSLSPTYDPQRLNVRSINEPYRTSIRRNDTDHPHVHSNGGVSRASVSSSEQHRPNARPKEKGIVKTPRGPIWATITPNNPDIDKQLIKSIVKKQGRQIRRVDVIGNEMERRNSESESVSTNESYSMKTSRTSTPEGLDALRRPYIPPEDYSRNSAPGSRPNSRESGYQTGRVPQRHPDEFGYNRDLMPSESFRDMPGAGQYPVLMPRQLSDGFDSVKRMSFRENSLLANPLLISELKIKQAVIKRTHSIKGDRDMNSNSPYKQCNSLDDIKEVNRQLS